MATYTSNYAWTKPEGSDPVDIGVLNNNLDSQDSIVHNAYMQLAPVFSAASTYSVNDVVLYANNLYKCITAVTVAGDWDAAKWTQVKVSDICGGGGGGGTSDYSQLTNLPSVNDVTLLGNKTSADLGLQDAIQIATMPTVSATYVGKIVQFVGTTTASYTHGYYYECINDGGTYSWTQLNVQPSSGGGTSDYTDLTNLPQINGVTLTGNKSTSDLGIDAAGVGLGNVPNVATDDQTPTFTTAQSRNNLISGEKLSLMLGKISKFFNDLKTVAFTGSYADLSNQPQINSNTLSGNKTTSDLGINADNVMMSDGVTSVEEKIGNMRMTKLWENPSTTSNFASQNVTLSNSDYDILVAMCYTSTSNGFSLSNVSKKGSGFILSYFSGSATYTRQCDRLSDTQYTIGDCRSSSVTSNNVLIPYVIYGIKLT